MDYCYGILSFLHVLCWSKLSLIFIVYHLTKAHHFKIYTLLSLVVPLLA